MVTKNPSEALAYRYSEVVTSAAALLSFARDSEKTGIVPRYSDPRFSRAIDTVFEVSGFGPPASYGYEDALILQSWVRAAQRIGNCYSRSGSFGITDTAEQVRMCDRNVARFATEVGRCLDAILLLLLLVTEIIAVLLAKEKDQDVRNRLIAATGWVEVRAAVATVMKRILSLLFIAELPQDWASERIAVLSDAAQRGWPHLALRDREEIQEFTEGVLELLHNSKAKNRLAAIDTLRRA